MVRRTKRWVFGTRTNKWYLVDSTDRDYKHGIPEGRMLKIGRKAARNEYLRGKLL